MAKFTFEIDVYSDPICPWCYIGKEALDKAMESYLREHPDTDFKLTWKPYMLWPNAGVSAYDKGTVLQTVFGTNTPSIRRRIAQLGAQYDIDFKWEGRTGNSRDAHKLILLAMEKDAAAAAASQNGSTTTSDSPSPGPLTPNGTTNGTTNGINTTATLNGIPNGASNGTPTTIPNGIPNGTPNNTHPPNLPRPQQTHQHATTTHLFTTTFQTPLDISSRPILATMAVSLGLCSTEAEAHAYLASPAADRAVDSASRAARRVGVRAVPSYVVQGRWQVGGMQGEGVWRRVLERVRAAVVGGSEGGEDEDRGGGGGGDGEGEGALGGE